MWSTPERILICPDALKQFLDFDQTLQHRTARKLCQHQIRLKPVRDAGHSKFMMSRDGDLRFLFDKQGDRLKLVAFARRDQLHGIVTKCLGKTKQTRSIPLVESRLAEIANLEERDMAANKKSSGIPSARQTVLQGVEQLLRELEAIPRMREEWETRLGEERREASKKTAELIAESKRLARQVEAEQREGRVRQQELASVEKAVRELEQRVDDARAELSAELSAKLSAELAAAAAAEASRAAGRQQELRGVSARLEQLERQLEQQSARWEAGQQAQVAELQQSRAADQRRSGELETRLERLAAGVEQQGRQAVVVAELSHEVRGLGGQLRELQEHQQAADADRREAARELVALSGKLDRLVDDFQRHADLLAAGHQGLSQRLEALGQLLQSTEQRMASHLQSHAVTLRGRLAAVGQAIRSRLRRWWPGAVSTK